MLRWFVHFVVFVFAVLFVVDVGIFGGGREAVFMALLIAYLYWLGSANRRAERAERRRAALAAAAMHHRIREQDARRDAAPFN